MVRHAAIPLDPMPPPVVALPHLMAEVPPLILPGMRGASADWHL